MIALMGSLSQAAGHTAGRHRAEVYQSFCHACIVKEHASHDEEGTGQQRITLYTGGDTLGRNDHVHIRIHSKISEAGTKDGCENRDL